MEFLEDGRLELYNLRDDLGESKNLAKENLEKTRALYDDLKAWREQIHAPMPTKNVPDPDANKAAPKKKGNGKKKAAKAAKSGD